MVCLRHDFQSSAQPIPYLFTIHYYLLPEIKSRPWMTQGRQKLTRYHLDSRQYTSHTAPFPASRKFRRWLGISSSPQRPSAFAGAPFGNHRFDDSPRFNGRTREWLLIDIPAPGPCSAVLSVPPPTFRGSLTGFPAYSSHLCLFTISRLL